MLTITRPAYDSDLLDAEWELIRRFIPRHPPMGKDPFVPKREIVNAIFYLNKHGCAWRGLPHDFPKWQTVYSYFRQWNRNGVWERINDALRRQVRVAEGKQAEPTAAIVDSPSGKDDGKRGARGYDWGKRINGRKRHILVDSLGLLLAVVVHSAKIQDRDGAKYLFVKAATSFPLISLVWADGAYGGQLIDWIKQWCGWTLEIVRKLENQSGFKLLPRRWVVERTFAWLGHSRRLSKDYEELVENSEAMIQISMIRLMLRRLCRPRVPQRR